MPDHEQTTVRLIELHKAFMEVHEAGMRALRERDYEAFGAAISAERAILEERQRISEAMLAEIKTRRQAD